MSYQSIDILQKSLASTVFSTKKDAKKAAGRALGTIVEIITYYLLREWGFTPNIQIETKLPEFGNEEITHNVEFTLHQMLHKEEQIAVKPLTYTRIKNLFDFNPQHSKNGSFIDKNNILKNSAVIGKHNNSIAICNLSGNKLVLSFIKEQASAMFECKRVGVEDGQKKGPQTIEKAKQGAYVALKSSSLQRVRDKFGNVFGVYFKDGMLHTQKYEEALNDCIQSDNLENFILSFGVVSNHGNWFTSNDMNKELKVLAQSYDRLLFLTDDGLYTFIEKTILNPCLPYIPIKNAFISSYRDGKKTNSFTKSKILLEAHGALTEFFHNNLSLVESWFNIISPNGMTIEEIKHQLHYLINKE
ncbi:MAG: hypothetical protein K2L34_13580 [Muribaculaceae bacterium]|nr:hypothetical protein [Muribaculaceae bacterium]